MPPLSRSNYVWIAVFAIALAVRLAWVMSLGNEIQWIDEQDFAAIAKHLIAGEGYVSSSFRANPIVPVYLATVFRLFGENYLVARVGQSVMGAAACVLIGRIGAMMISPSAGALSGLALALYPPHIFLSGIFYVDSWLTFFCALTVYLIMRARQRGGRVGYAVLCGVCEGLTILTRPAFIVFIAGPIVTWLASARVSRHRRAAMCALYLVACAATVLPWTYRNYRVFGRPVLVASGFWAMLWRGNNELATGGPDDRLLDWSTPWWRERLQALPPERQQELTERFQAVDRQVVMLNETVGDTAIAMDEVLKPLALEALVSHPTRTLGLFARKVATLYSAFSETATANERSIPLRRWVAPLSFYPILALALIGAAFGLPQWRELLPVYFLIVSVTGVYALLTACTRFRLPLDPFFIIFASLALSRVVPGLRPVHALSARTSGPSWYSSVGVPADGPSTAVRRLHGARIRPGSSPPQR